VPSPPAETLQIGSLGIQIYGIFVLLALLVWILVTAQVWKRGGGDAIEAAWACLIALPVAFIGARLWHVFTDYELYRGDATGIFDVTEGGLSVFGAVAGGVLAFAVWCRARGWPLATFLECAVLGLPLAQAIGRWGNYFNQEIVGRPTDLPWALFVDPAYRPFNFVNDERFHPLFLYESLLDLAIFAALLLLWRPVHERFRTGSMVGVYLILYGAVRLGLEALRIDPAPEVAFLRVNQIAALAVLLTGVLILYVLDRRRPPKR
jgi:prolipoprotein diacylglyceryl transferase